MKLKKQLTKLAIPLAALSLSGCIKLDVTPITLDVVHHKAYARPTNPKNPDYDLDLDKPEDFQKLQKLTCFSAEDLAEIERDLNQCK